MTVEQTYFPFPLVIEEAAPPNVIVIQPPGQLFRLDPCGCIVHQKPDNSVFVIFCKSDCPNSGYLFLGSHE